LIAPTATPLTSATWKGFIPYFTKARMCANFDTGISGLTWSAARALRAASQSAAHYATAE
jgi:hypothetical protein